MRVKRAMVAEIYTSFIQFMDKSDGEESGEIKRREEFFGYKLTWRLWEVLVETFRSSRGDLEKCSWRLWEVLVHLTAVIGEFSCNWQQNIRSSHVSLRKMTLRWMKMGPIRPMTATRTPSSLNHFVITNFARFYIKSARLFMRSNQPGFERISKFCQVLELFAITPHAEW